MRAYGLTKKQHELMVYIESYISKHGYSPSFEEMKDAMGLASKSGIHRLVHGLKERNLVRLLRNRSRSVEINVQERDATGIGL